MLPRFPAAGIDNRVEKQTGDDRRTAQRQPVPPRLEQPLDLPRLVDEDALRRR
jgi:hypothetical protein